MNPEALRKLVLAAAGAMAIVGAMKAADVIHHPTIGDWALVASMFVMAVLVFQAAWSWQPPPQ